MSWAFLWILKQIEKSIFPYTLKGTLSNTKNFESSFIEIPTEQFSSFQLHFRSNGSNNKKGWQKWKSVKGVCRVSAPISKNPENRIIRFVLEPVTNDVLKQPYYYEKLSHNQNYSKINKPRSYSVNYDHIFDYNHKNFVFRFVFD